MAVGVPRRPQDEHDSRPLSGLGMSMFKNGSTAVDLQRGQRVSVAIMFSYRPGFGAGKGAISTVTADAIEGRYQACYQAEYGDDGKAHDDALRAHCCECSHGGLHRLMSWVP